MSIRRSVTVLTYMLALGCVLTPEHVLGATLSGPSAGRDRSDPCYLDPSSCKNESTTNTNAGGTPLKIKPNTDIILLQPLDDTTQSLQAKPGIQIFFDYFNLSWPWILGVCAGLAVLQAMIGGMQMMLGGMRDEGKDRMKWATAGLLIIALAGMILNTINPLFYQ